MTLNKLQLTVTRLVVLLAGLGIMLWVWRVSERSRRPPTTSTWVEKLQSGDADDRKYAIQELTRASADDAQSVVPALLEALKDPKSSVRNEAVLALGQFLARALKDRGSVLSEQCRAGATALLEVIKSDGDNSVRASAAFALASLHRALAAPGIKPDRSRADDPLDPRTMARAFNTMLDHDPANRLAMLVPYESLGEIGEPAPPAILAALDDPSPNVRKVALQVLGQFTSGSDQAVPVLLRDAELKEPMSGIQAAKGSGPGSALARAALGLHPTAAVVPILAKAIESPNPEVRRAAVILLGRVEPRGQAAVPILLEALKAASNPAGGRADSAYTGDILQSLARIAPGAPLPKPTADLVIEAMSSYLESPQAFLRIAAAKALGEFGPSATGALPKLRALAEDEKATAAAKEAAADAIAKIEPEKTKDKEKDKKPDGA